MRRGRIRGSLRVHIILDIMCVLYYLQPRMAVVKIISTLPEEKTKALENEETCLLSYYMPQVRLECLAVWQQTHISPDHHHAPYKEKNVFDRKCLKCQF